MPKAERLCIAAIQGQNKHEAAGSGEEEEDINKEGKKDDEEDGEKGCNDDIE